MHHDISVLSGLFTKIKGKCSDGGSHRLPTTDTSIRRVLLYADTDAAIQQAPKEVDAVFDSCILGRLFVLEMVDNMGIGECNLRKFVDRCRNDLLSVYKRDRFQPLCVNSHRFVWSVVWQVQVYRRVCSLCRCGIPFEEEDKDWFAEKYCICFSADLCSYIFCMEQI